MMMPAKNLRSVMKSVLSGRSFSSCPNCGNDKLEPVVANSEAEKAVAIIRRCSNVFGVYWGFRIGFTICGDFDPAAEKAKAKKAKRGVKSE
ncbi:hypothetical protein EUTSA_v10021843mg [Eutrema salsugineum]|uniref:Uncharacterized protein n=1 Tax=Eutrema salsugineum TaxID=72664 RepID=V4LYY6_EUTSA|nr:hypothetical protein EUTSA_v10021843mg [Eutrema salsugineum]